MSVKEEIRKILDSHGRVSADPPEELAAVNVNLIAAVRELQRAVVHLAEEIDRDREHRAE